MANKEIPTYIETGVKGKFVLNPEWVEANKKAEAPAEKKAAKPKATKKK